MTSTCARSHTQVLSDQTMGCPRPVPEWKGARPRWPALRSVKGAVGGAQGPPAGCYQCGLRGGLGSGSSGGGRGCPAGSRRSRRAGCQRVLTASRQTGLQAWAASNTSNCQPPSPPGCELVKLLLLYLAYYISTTTTTLPRFWPSHPHTWPWRAAPSCCCSPAFP